MSTGYSIIRPPRGERVTRTISNSIIHNAQFVIHDTLSISHSLRVRLRLRLKHREMHSILLYHSQSFTSRCGTSKRSKLWWWGGTPTGTGSVYAYRFPPLRFPLSLGIRPSGACYDAEAVILGDAWCSIILIFAITLDYTIPGVHRDFPTLTTRCNKDINARRHTHIAHPPPSGMHRIVDGTWNHTHWSLIKIAINQRRWVESCVCLRIRLIRSQYHPYSTLPYPGSCA